LNLDLLRKSATLKKWPLTRQVSLRTNSYLQWRPIPAKPKSRCTTREPLNHELATNSMDTFQKRFRDTNFIYWNKYLNLWNVVLQELCTLINITVEVPVLASQLKLLCKQKKARTWLQISTTINIIHRIRGIWEKYMWHP
jgi:hypothetical protein